MRSPLMAAKELKVRGRAPSLPNGLRVYAVGDIHGRLDLLEKLLREINADLAQRPATRPIYVFLGDYIDRGTWSKETIYLLIAHDAGRECVFLRGNHDLIAIVCLSYRTKFYKCLRLG